jgi:hypothetical protein
MYIAPSPVSVIPACIDEIYFVLYVSRPRFPSPPLVQGHAKVTPPYHSASVVLSMTLYDSGGQPLFFFFFRVLRIGVDAAPF